MRTGISAGKMYSEPTNWNITPMKMLAELSVAMNTGSLNFETSSALKLPSTAPMHTLMRNTTGSGMITP